MKNNRIHKSIYGSISSFSISSGRCQCHLIIHIKKSITRISVDPVLIYPPSSVMRPSDPNHVSCMIEQVPPSSAHPQPVPRTRSAFHHCHVDWCTSTAPPYTHFHNNSQRNNMCFLHPRKHPTHSGHPTHPHDQRAFGEARDRWERRQNISWHAISYRSKVEAGEKRESCWKILNPSGTFFRKEIGNMCTQVFIQSSECRVLLSRP